jgi:hypothetical protein
METPDTIEGFLTEAIMIAITRKVGKMPTHNYNAIYEGVLEALNRHLPEIRAAGQGLTRKELLMRGFC